MTPHLYIVGQTASGKSRFSQEVCELMGYEILNTDSLLFYKNLDIGTAKPTKEEQNKVVYHLIDFAEIGEEVTAAAYLKKAKPILAANKKNILCVGGSGFYINALDVGLLPLPETDTKIKEKVKKIKDPLVDIKQKDPESLQSVSEKDLYRIQRALEVFYQTGKPLSQWKKEFDPKPRAKKIAFYFEREELLRRVILRTEKMITEGFIDEVKKILLVADKNWKPLHAVGYKQVVQYLRGEIISLKDLKNEIVLRTMQLAKKQKTWFRKDPSVKWFQASEQDKAKDYVIRNLEQGTWKQKKKEKTPENIWKA